MDDDDGAATMDISVGDTNTNSVLNESSQPISTAGIDDAATCVTDAAVVAASSSPVMRNQLVLTSSNVSAVLNTSELNDTDPADGSTLFSHNLSRSISQISQSNSSVTNSALKRKRGRRRSDTIDENTELNISTNTDAESFSFNDSMAEQDNSHMASLTSGLTRALETFAVGSQSKKPRRMPLSTKDKEALRVSLAGSGGEPGSASDTPLAGRRSLRGNSNNGSPERIMLDTQPRRSSRQTAI
jgi:hypothetical protein